MTNLFKYQSTWIIALIILIIPTFWSLVRPGFFPMQDDLQAFRLFEMDKCFQDLQLPCRWIPDMGYQYGYPQFNFYSPSVFYLGEVFHLFGLQFIDVVKLLFVLGFIFSAISMFIFLRAIFGHLAAFVGSVLYSFLPFKAVEVFVRGSLSEFWALGFFPLLFWSSYKLIETNNKKYGIWFAVSLGGILITHVLMSLLILTLTGVWILYLVWSEKKWHSILKIKVWGILGFGLAAFFILPAILEKQFVHTETLLSGYFDYRQHFVPIQKLFLSNIWGYGSSNLGQTEMLNLSTGIVQWTLGLVGFVLSILLWKKEKKISGLVFLMAVLSIFSLFMIHQKSSFIWSLIPILSWLQFPWRFLAISGFLLCILSAATIYYLQKWNKLGVGTAALSIFIVLIVTVTFFQPKDWQEISDQDKFSGASWEKQLTISIFDYLPIYAKFPPNHKAPELPEVLDGDANFSNYQKRSDFQSGQVAVLNSATIRLPLFDFPGMKVKVDEQQISHTHDDCQNEEYCLGLITFKLPAGNHQFSAHLENTPIRTVANIISLLSLIILILSFKFKKGYKWN